MLLEHNPQLVATNKNLCLKRSTPNLRRDRALRQQVSDLEPLAIGLSSILPNVEDTCKGMLGRLCREQINMENDLEKLQRGEEEQDLIKKLELWVDSVTF